MIRSVLIPLDGSQFAERAIPVGSELAQALAASVVLVCAAGREMALDSSLNEADRRWVAEQYAGVREEDHALSTDPRMVEHTQGQVRAIAEAEAYLSTVAARLVAEGLSVETAVPYGAAAEGILTEIGLHSAGLVVMAAHSRSGLGRFAPGSVAQAVLARCPVPVVLVPPEQRTG